jgi:tRNA(Ile2) C34 agmatinyltransferase TiaS
MLTRDIVINRGIAADENEPAISAVEDRVEGGLRRCLMCGQEFSSDGSHNHICKRCKSTQAWRQSSG